MYRACPLAILVSLLLQGCSIHPLQQDVTGLPTAVLTDHIRCEARTAIRDKAVQLLKAYRLHDAEVLASELESDQFLSTFDPKTLDRTEREFYNRYVQTAIAFNFTFDITEESKASAGVDLLKTFSGGAVSLGLSANDDLTRNNSRRFIVSDTFDELIHSKTLACGLHGETPNYLYPIAGNIGLAEVISTFVDLNESKSLDFLDKSQVFADTLTFTTTVGASATPKLTFVTGGRNLQVTDAPFSGGVSRIDKHSVIIGLSLGSSSKDSSKKALSTGGVADAVVPNSAILTSATGTASQRAIAATIIQRLNTYLDRTLP